MIDVTELNALIAKTESAEEITPDKLYAKEWNIVLNVVKAIAETINNPSVVVETSENYLSIADTNGNEIVRLNNNIEVKTNGDLYVAGNKIN